VKRANYLTQQIKRAPFFKALSLLGEESQLHWALQIKSHQSINQSINQAIMFN
jgi:hypothetical protein